MKKTQNHFPVVHAFSIVMTLLFLTMGSQSRGQAEFQNGLSLMSISGQVQAPMRMANDQDGNVYVTDFSQCSIVCFDGSGQFRNSIQTGFKPVALAIDMYNFLYVSDAATGNIYKLDQLGNQTVFYQGCGHPSDAVFDLKGFLYIADSEKGRVAVIDQSGQQVRYIGEETLRHPVGISYDPVKDLILVSEHGGLSSDRDSELDASIHAFDPMGNHLFRFGEFGHEVGQFSRIQGLYCDGEGRIYAIDSYQASICVFDSDGVYMDTFGDFGSEPGKLTLPMDLIVDEKGRCWVTSLNTKRIEVYSTDAMDIPHPGENPVPDGLMACYPNPFRHGVHIPFVLREDGTVVCNIRDFRGNPVRILELGKLPKGDYTSPELAIYWDGSKENGEMAADGIYIAEIQMGLIKRSRKMMLIR